MAATKSTVKESYLQARRRLQKAKDAAAALPDPWVRSVIVGACTLAIGELDDVFKAVPDDPKPELPPQPQQRGFGW